MIKGSDRRRPRIAYLNSQYPSLSHTFIEREIRQVRKEGVEVTTFSVRPPGRQSTLGKAHAAAARGTTSLLDHSLTLIRRAAAVITRHPLRCVRAVAHAQRLSPPGLRQRLLHIAYSIEAARLVWELRQRDLRHIHVHMANSGAMIALLACRIDPALTYSLSIHGSAEFFQVDRYQLGTKAESALFVRCISDFCRAQVMAWSDPDAWPRMHVVHCGIDPGMFQPRQRRRVNRVRLIAVGRLCEIKGYELLLRACNELGVRGMEWSLDLVGDGPARTRLEALVQALGIQRHVTFSGAVPAERIAAHYRRADIMVVSSFMEGVPVVLMEAMAAGLPVVATRVGGIPELVEHEVSGVLTNAGSVDALADGLCKFAGKSTHIRYGDAGRRRVVREFNIERVGRAMIELFERYGVIEPLVHFESSESRRPAPTRAPRQSTANSGVAIGN